VHSTASSGGEADDRVPRSTRPSYPASGTKAVCPLALAPHLPGPADAGRRLQEYECLVIAVSNPFAPEFGLAVDPAFHWRTGRLEQHHDVSRFHRSEEHTSELQS